MPTLKKPPANRTVALLTPLVFAPLAGAISVAAADVAGTNIDPNSLTAIFIAGATIAFGKAAQWTKGWQAFEQRDVGAALAEPAAVDAEGDFSDEIGEEDLAGEFESDEEPSVDEDPEFDEEPEFLFDSDEDIDDELLALTAGHED